MRHSCSTHSFSLVSLMAVPFVCPSAAMQVSGLETFSPTSPFPLPPLLYFFSLIFLPAPLLFLFFFFFPARPMDMQSMLRSK